GFSLLRQIIKDDQNVLATVHPVLANGRACVWCQVLEACWVRCGGSHDGGVFQCTLLFEGLAYGSDGRCLLANCHVDAANLLGLVAGFPVGALVQNGVNRDSGLTGLAVTNDQLTLATADRDHGVDSLQTGLHWLVHALALGNAWCLELQGAAALGSDWAQVVQWLAQWVNHAAEVAVANWNRKDLAGALDLLASVDAR